MTDFRAQLGKFRLERVEPRRAGAFLLSSSPSSSLSLSTSPWPLQQLQLQQLHQCQPQTPTSQSSVTASRSSKRVSTACDFCRKRKKKCDFRYPNCSACTRAGVRCTIAPPGPLVADGPVPRDQLETLQKRVSWLEEVVHQKTGMVITDVPTGAAIDAEGDLDWWYQVPSLLARSSGYTNHARSSHPHQAGASSSLSSAHKLSNANASPSGIGTELPNVGEIFRDHLEHRRPPIARPGVIPRPLSSLYSTTPTTPDTPRILRLTSLEEAERAAAQYFDSMGYQYPFVHRSEFFADLSRIYSGSTPAPDALHSYHITMATALLIKPVDGIQAVDFYRHSQETLVLALQNEDLVAVRALLSVALYTMFATSGPSVWHILGTAMRLATSLGLHRARQSTNLVDDEMAKRVFWSLYNLDRLIAVTLGRPLSIADEDITVSLPREFNDDWTEAPGSSSMTIPVQVVRLRRIFSRIYRYRSCPLSCIWH